MAEATLASYETNQPDTATTSTYAAIERAFRHFNTTLFAGKLPDCVLVLHRKKSARGYFWAGIWSDASEQKADEIALNPDWLMKRSDRETLSTLAHEMVHLEQQHFGEPSRQGYHNKEWAEMMDRIGLTSSSTGEPGGKRTGQKVSHYIVDGGPFDLACADLIRQGFTIPWKSLDTTSMKARAAKSASKTKYTCSGCNQNAWAKPDASLCCGECGTQMDPE